MPTCRNPLPSSLFPPWLQYFGGSVAYLQFTGGNQQEGLAGLEGAQAASGVNDHIPNQVTRLLLHTLVAVERHKLKPRLCVAATSLPVECATRQTSPSNSPHPTPHMPAPQNDFDTPYVGSLYVTPEGDLELSYPLYLFVDLEASFGVSATRSRLCRRSALTCSDRYDMPCGFARGLHQPINADLRTNCMGLDHTAGAGDRCRHHFWRWHDQC